MNTNDIAAKLHHYIPQFILRNFTDEDQKLHCFNKGSCSAFEVPTKKVFAKNNLYTEILDSGNRSTATETKLSEIEGIVSVPVKKIIRASQSFDEIVLTSSDERLLLEFLDYQILRHPYLKDLIRTHFGTKSLQPHVELELGRSMNLHELEQYYSSNEETCSRRADRVFATSIISSKSNPGSFLNDLLKKRIGIVRLWEDAGEFVIGDKQFVFISPEGRCVNRMSPDTWLLYPISWNVGILWGLEDGDRKLNIFADPRWVIDINQRTFSQSQVTIAGRSQHVIQSVLDSVK
ncbi:MAG: DUF4238 domain-containing protein [Rhodothermaceae bacterium]|nr:DUF4238 domain-containing protein [Rhodothermaceae bacterium]MXW33918.1 DUF4238 domain-containing protein [Rhodothermaceae bacterium]MYC04087.1 DUF4238 domain-containing protein [Rhodothermaceae bacterium]MYE61802.1 DUF4238 domain-containing protein [Rhodothermaceae bacterium]MYI16027.1 DUF4238 domain-containing protein [Rhodothermaceae bacterium]